VWMARLLAFVIQAVSYEYRRKPGNFLGQKTFEMFLVTNGLLGTVLIGTAVATFFTGSKFSVNKANILDLTSGSMPVISEWKGPAYGLEAALNPQNLFLGLAVFFLARVLALLYFINRVDSPAIMERSRRQLWINSIPFLLFFLAFTIWLLFSEGFAVDPSTKAISMEPYKYLHNLIQMPVVAVVFVLGVVLVLLGIFRTVTCFEKCHTKGIWLTGLGTILTVWMLFLLAGFNNTAFYPSTYDLQSSLTIENSSSSRYTLVIMSYVSLMVPFVLAYIWYAWRSIDNKRINTKELDSETHVY
jgi:cytochrome d ubiquinol oxidase subunit II